MRRTLFLLATSALLLTGCGPSPAAKHWSHPNADADKTSDDLRNCRQLAEKRAGLDAGAFTDGRRDSAPFSSYDRDRLRRRIDNAVAACMTSHGYTYAPQRTE